MKTLDEHVEHIDTNAYWDCHTISHTSLWFGGLHLTKLENWKFHVLLSVLALGCVRVRCSCCTSVFDVSPKQILHSTFFLFLLISFTFHLPSLVQQRKRSLHRFKPNIRSIEATFELSYSNKYKIEQHLKSVWMPEHQTGWSN